MSRSVGILLLCARTGWHMVYAEFVDFIGNNNSKIIQNGKREVEGNVKICLPAAQKILTVPQYM